MRAVVETVAGRELEIRLDLGQLDEIARVNPQFEEMAVAFQAGVWDWREVVAILGAALRPHGVKVEAVVADVGAPGAKALASRIWFAAMDVKPPAAEAGAGNGAAVAEAGTGGSPSPDSSATA